MKDGQTDAERLQARLEKVREKSAGYVPPLASIPEDERPLPPNPETEEYRRRYGSDA